MMENVMKLWPEGPNFIPDSAFPLSTDSVLLSDFAMAKSARRAVDLGCGSGILMLLMLWRQSALRCDGVELRPRAAELARRNLAENGLAARGGVICGDLRRVRELLPHGEYDLAVCNPPYFPAHSGLSSPDPQRAAARSMESCTPEDVCAAAAFLCPTGARLCMVHRCEFLPRVLRAMGDGGFEPKRLRMVHSAAGRAPSLFLAEGRRGAKPGLATEPPLILKNDRGEDSDEIKRIYHLGGL
jgi:tRNA1Val (adenine37-N6)-methyltransferase